MQDSASTTPIYSPLRSPSHMSSSTSALHLRVDSVDVDPFSEVLHLSTSRPISPQRNQRNTQQVQQVDTELIKLDSELKCTVCKDFYDVPMSSKCQHMFCAGCAKFDCNNKITGLSCPICGYSFTSFTQFYKNTLIEDLIKEYKSNRELITRLYAFGKQAEVRERREETKRSTKTEESFISITDCNSDSFPPVEEKVKSKCVLGKLVNNNDSDSIHSNGQKNKRRRMDDNDDGSLSYKNISTSIKPLCKKPKVVYGIMSEKKLKNVLKEEGLLANGSKNDMVARHSYFINLYNSNVDATNPKSKGELLREMKKWERAHQSDEARDADMLKKTLTNPEEINFYDILSI